MSCFTNIITGLLFGGQVNILSNLTFIGTQYVNHGLHVSKLLKEKPKDAIKIKVPRIVSDALWNLAQQHRKDNRYLQPMKGKPWLLQGLITCGLCGHAFMVQPNHTRRIYNCRGRLHIVHIDNSPRCTVPNIDADWLEKELWERIEAVLNDPNKLEMLLNETIDNLKNREEELSARKRPVDERLAEIAEQESRLAEDWVRMSLDPVKYLELKQSLQKEEARLNSMRSNIDPAQIEELERTRGLLRFWDSQKSSMAWNTENENGQMIRNVDKPHDTVFKLVNFEDSDVSKAVSFPATRREMLDMLQVRLVTFDDRVEVNAIFPVESIEYLLCTSTGQPTP